MKNTDYGSNTMTERELNRILLSISESDNVANYFNSLQNDMKLLADEVVRLRREINKHKASTLEYCQDKKDNTLKDLDLNNNLWEQINYPIKQEPNYTSCSDCLRYFYSYDAKDDEGLCYYCWFDKKIKLRKKQES